MPLFKKIEPAACTLAVVALFCMPIGLNAAPTKTATPKITPAPAVQDANPASPENAPISSAAESIYTAARPKLLQVRTLLGGTGQQSSIGSAFLVDADGLAITNYHVVSQYALEPDTYRLEYATPDGARGPLALLMIDVVNDLAAVRIDKKDHPFFKFGTKLLEKKSLKGERLYSMGNPLDLGFAIVEGTYNGPVDHSYNDRIHFSGAINPGMSGGPVVMANNEVVGINVAKRIGGELVSFLVPARFAVALVDLAKNAKPMAPSDVKAEIGRQLAVWQNGLYTALSQEKVSVSTFGPYAAQDNSSPWFTCWADTNVGEMPKPLAILNTTNCRMDNQLFVTDEVNTGAVRFSQSYAKSAGLNPFQFSVFLSWKYYMLLQDSNAAKYYARRFCHQNFYKPKEPDRQPLTQVIWCAQAYRDFDDLYDVSLMAVTQDKSDEALISRLSMKGVSYPNAVAYANRFLGALQWNK